MKLCCVAELSPFRICQRWLFTKFVLIGNELYDAISLKDDFTRNFPRTLTLAPRSSVEHCSKEQYADLHSKNDPNENE